MVIYKKKSYYQEYTNKRIIKKKNVIIALKNYEKSNIIWLVIICSLSCFSFSLCYYGHVC